MICGGRPVNDVVMTIDVDWAPDFAITKVANRLIKNNIKATWFVTHNSPAIQKLFKQPLFEVGIHPNFMSNSTHGKTYEEVVLHMINIVSHAKTVRTHGLFQSSNIMKMMAVDFGLETDTSIYLREASHIVPFEVYYGNSILLRIPFFWTEDGEMYKPNSSFLLKDKNLELPGLKVFAFHPIHLYLNSKNMKNYNALRKVCDIRYCDEKEVGQFINNGVGANSFLDELIQYILNGHNDSKTISDISHEWKESKSR